MANQGLRFRVGRIPVDIPFSGLIGIVLIAILWAPSFPGAEGRSNYPLALVFGLLFYLIILLHELAHAAAATLLGFPVKGITLWILGGFTSFEVTSRSPWRQAVIALVGPLSTLAIAAGCFALRNHVGGAYELVATLGVASLLLGIFNLLPGLPLDGGAVLSHVVAAITRDPWRGQIVAGWTGRVLAIVVVVLEIALEQAQGSISANFVIALLLGLFLWNGASRGLINARLERRLPEVSIAPLTRRAIGVQVDLPLAEALRQLALAQAGGIVVLNRADEPIGLVNEAAVAAVPIDRRPWVPVSTVMRTLEATSKIALDASGAALLELLRASQAPEFLVLLPDGRVYGMLSRVDLETALARLAGVSRSRR